LAGGFPQIGAGAGQIENKGEADVGLRGMDEERPLLAGYPGGRRMRCRDVVVATTTTAAAV